jgi:hypothetical protein
MKIDTEIDTCLFCENRPTIYANFYPKPEERIMFGKFRRPYIKIRYGLCDEELERSVQQIRLKLHHLFEGAAIK